jgi:hypothetical protein
MANLNDLVYKLLLPIAETMIYGKLPLIHAYQNDGRYTKPYAVIKIDTIQYPQHEQHFPPGENGYSVVAGWRKAIVEIQVFGRNAGDIVRQFMLRLATNTSVMNQVELNVSIGNRLLLSEIPELLNLSQYEPRGIHQFEMYFSEATDDDVGLIEEVEIGYVEPPTEWDKDDTDWDNGETVWDGSEYCKTRVRAYPDYTPPHPSVGEQ